MTPRYRRRLERGGVMTIVAVLLAGGVLMGMAAISIDVGRLLAEKRQLQNSSDAASLSLADDCWASPGSCAVTSNEQTLANGNSDDNTTTITSACSVNIAGSPINGCPTATGALADCAPLPDAFAAMSGLPYVEVRTRTRIPNGDNGLTNYLASALGITKSSAAACARAAVGTIDSGVGELPITISACEWSRQTGGNPVTGSGGSYYPAPNYQGTTTPDYGYGMSGSPAWPTGAPPAPAANPGGEVVLLVQNPPGGQTPPSSCPTWNGHALPGGFSILETVSGNPCKAVELPYKWMHTSPGTSVGCDLSQYVGKVVALPVFSCTLDYLPNREANEATDPCNTGNGSNAWYWRRGYAAFYLSGYRLQTNGSIPNRVRSINPNNTLANGNNPCGNSELCLAGWFTTGSLSGTGISGAPTTTNYFGVYRVVPAG
jgi:hypothetical protein